ncbi:MAG TPA: GAF domain-containing protein, partial [Solirubrobacter sp.]
YTMVVAPLIRDGKTIGVLSVLDRRDGGPYLREDLGKVALFADLAVVALDLDTFPLSSTGGRTLLA